MGILTLLVIFVCFLFACCNAKNVVSTRCYATTSDPYLFVGSRTTYDYSRGNNSLTRLPPESNCKPMQIWVYIRHGTRYPDEKVILKFLKLRSFRDQVLENHEIKRRGHLCQADLEMLRNWNINENELMPESLTPAGEEQLRSFGERLRNVFPEFFDTPNVTQQDFLVKSSDEHTTWMSMESLVKVLFGSKDAVKPVKAETTDPIVRHPDDFCKKYRTNFEIDNVDEEPDNFMLTPDFKNLQRSVSERLGFDYILDQKTLDVLYDVCRYENAYHDDRPSSWCSVFSDEDIRLFEYREDVGCYYKAGPGRKMSKSIGCSPVADMVQHFRNLEDENKSSHEPKGIFYFGHTMNLAAILSVMEINKDTPPLLATNYHSKTNRNFRLSYAGPFAGNIMAVFYKCNDAKTPHRVTLHLTERLHRFDGCDADSCSWEYMKESLSWTSDECSLDLCNGNGGRSNFVSHKPLILSIVSLAIASSHFVL